MSELHYVPVFEVDPNTPGRMVNGKVCIYTGVRNTDMLEDFKEGTYKIGDLAFGYQPHEEYDRETGKHVNDLRLEDSGMGFPCRIIDWHEVRHPEAGSLKMLVYLEIDPAYVIVDRRASVSNDEGTDDGNDRTHQGVLHRLEDASGEPGRSPGSSLAM